MKRAAIASIISGCLAGLFLIVACGGGSSDGGGGVPSLSLADLEGTWFGPYPISDTMDWVMDGAGNVTDLKVSGASLGYAGSAVQIDNNYFQWELPDYGSGGMFVDELALHCFFFPDAGPVIILEKGATAFPTFAEEDILGSWSGFGYAYSVSLGEMVRIPSVTAMFTDNVVIFAFSGSFDGDTMLGAAASMPPDYGQYGLNFSLDSSILTGAAGLSPDKSFLGIVASIDSPAVYPDDLVFMLLTRN